MDSVGQARALGRVEGRAEALEEIADLHGQIAVLTKQVEQLMLDQEKTTKELMTTVYKDLKQEFRRQTTSTLTPKEAMDIIKPCLRRVAEVQVPQSQTLFRNVSFMAKDLPTTTATSHPLSPPTPPVFPVTPPTRLPVAEPPVTAEPSILDEPVVLNHICVAATEKVGAGRAAHMVYVIQVRTGDTGLVLSQVKRRYKDFVWLWERLSSAYVFACIPTLPPKNGLRDNSKFNPRFVEKRKRALQLWMNHLAWHYAMGFSTEMQTFLDGSDLVHVPRTPPLLLPRRRRTSSNEGSSARKQDDQSIKRIQEKLPVLQRHLVKASKRLDGLIKVHADTSCSVAAFGNAATHASNFERLHGSATAWDGFAAHALLPLQQWHDDTCEMLDVSLQETLHFQSAQVMPRFEKQVHDLTRDMVPSTAEKLSLEWDEVQTIQARAMLESLLHVATHMQQSHHALVDVWASARSAVHTVATPRSFVPPPTSSSAPLPSPLAAHSQHVPEFAHPTLERPLKPNTFEFMNHHVDPDAEDARTLFGGPQANPNAVFSVYESSDEDEDEDDDAPAFSASWDLYIDRLRRKQKKQAKAEAAAVEEVKRKEKEAEAATAESRKNRKRPQSMQWPLKRMARSQPKVVVQDDLSAMPKSMSTSSLDRMDPTPPAAASKAPLEPPTSDVRSVDNWMSATTDGGQVYYYHRLTRATRWTKPDKAVLDDIEERLAAQEEATQRRVEERRQWYQENKQQQEKEAAEVDASRHLVTTRVRDWARNKDVVMLLRSLHEVLPPSLLKPSSAACPYQVDGAATVASVKKAYMKAVRTIHPDKLPKGDFDVKDRFLAQTLFSTLTLAHDEYQRTHATSS
ncbi:hypothetical protein SDRG_07253 [Saprolegnia diclina VS20]|uniref:PX domain-containing protein n=1 Tax=Saprolegnia diclina (strain VS20) TaxID=1156394 RepID=T0QJY7_SAPDV|nr:hypothetical protein SDRG_07253 [Saprolegnia diclina VS20]EQC35011.1 hypothetical protein SDRG_07253 [Saprolegnia diclina VS20]|eukprot:XP_008611295.1 hypothetical protein SDRG_07253 [Saprolegnia diclina VS20]